MNQAKLWVITHMALLLLATSVIYSCNNNNASEAKVTNKAQRQVTLSEDDSAKPILISDSIAIHKTLNQTLRNEFIIIPKFEVEVRLSSAAEEKFKNNKETIIIGADFTGVPKDKSSDYYRHLGWIEVAHAEKELKNSRLAVFNNVKYPQAIYDSLAEKVIRVNIYVVSGRRTSENNLLYTEIISKSISEVKGKRLLIYGKLIEEMDSTDIY
ncbi:hypothetical protein [Rufibacter immobilis]|uniref:hypothetical protein n=1 Tax=Rufibacter immobilis TaxID=1348778 RepID=UPI0035EDBDF8